MDFEHWGDPNAAPCSVSADELKDMIDNGGFDQGRVAALEPWPTSTAKPFSPEYVAGHLSRTYDRDVEACSAYRWSVWRRLKTPCSPVRLLGGMQGLRGREGTAWRCSGVRAAVRS